MSSAQPLSNLRLELLKLCSSNIEDADLENVRRFLAKYFAGKAIKEDDGIWDKRANVHLRADDSRKLRTYNGK